MFKRRLTIDDFFLTAVNLIPLFGVWFYDWDARHVFIVYCLETVIIGVINVIKMASVTLFVRKKDIWQNGDATSMQSGWLFIFFFIIHYGFFVFIQTQLFFAFSGTIPDGSMLMKYTKIPELLGSEGRLLLLLFVAWYTAQNVFGFFASGVYKTISMGRLLFEPYVRIFVQQLVVLMGSIFLRFEAGNIFIFIFIAAKIFFELFINLSRFLEVAEKKERLKHEMRENKKS